MQTQLMNVNYRKKRLAEVLCPHEKILILATWSFSKIDGSITLVDILILGDHVLARGYEATDPFDPRSTA